MRVKHNKQMQLWAMLCHFSALLAWLILFAVVFVGIPLFLPLNILAPFLIWKFRKVKYPWVDFQGRESLNFQISLTFYIVFVIAISLLLVLASCSVAVTTNGEINQVSAVLDGLLFIWMCFTIALLLLQSFLVTFAAAKAYNGEHYRYPFTLRVLR
jgi:hypothetical protein